MIYNRPLRETKEKAEPVPLDPTVGCQCRTLPFHLPPLVAASPSPWWEHLLGPFIWMETDLLYFQVCLLVIKQWQGWNVESNVNTIITTLLHDPNQWKIQFGCGHCNIGHSLNINLLPSSVHLGCDDGGQKQRKLHTSPLTTDHFHDTFGHSPVSIYQARIDWQCSISPSNLGQNQDFKQENCGSATISHRRSVPTKYQQFQSKSTISSQPFLLSPQY